MPSRVLSGPLPALALSLAACLPAPDREANPGVPPEDVGSRRAALHPSPECISPLPSGSIRLSARTLEPEVSLKVLPGTYHVVQFRRAPNDEETAALAKLGIHVLDPIPERAYAARIDAPLSKDDLLALPHGGGVARVLPWTAELKVHPALVEESKVSELVAIHWFSEELGREKMLEQLGAKRVHRIGRTDIVSLGSATIEALSALDPVQFIEPYVDEVRTHSRAGEIAHRASALYASPHFLSGRGVTVGIFDAGWIDWDHPDLAGRVLYNPDLLSWRGTPIAGSVLDRKHDHATAMAGIIASSGEGNAAARGTAPAARMVSYAVAYNYFDPDELVASESALHGWHVGNHSYGNGWPCGPPNQEPCKSDPRWSSYIPSARSTDRWAYRNGVLSVYSAGNDGYVKSITYPDWLDDNWQTIHSGGVAKNAVSVCAMVPGSGISRDLIKDDSSKGPTSDGRVKPDLCALGLPYSTDEPTVTTALGGGYRTTYATSPAAAEVTGAVALLHEAYGRMVPAGTPMPPALAKGILLHTARDVDERGSRWIGTMGRYEPARTATGPDYTTGWGFMDLGAAFEALNDRRWLADAVRSGRQNDYVTARVEPGEEVRITLIWDDPPASPGVERALVNQLDLRVTDLESGAVMRPFVLDPTRPSRPAFRGRNVLDNVEQVRFVHEGSTPTTFLVEVMGEDIPTAVQRYFLLSETRLTSPRLVVDEYRFRRILDANLLRKASCSGLFLPGPELELTRRVRVWLKETEAPLESKFVEWAMGPVAIVPTGIPDAHAPERWSDFHADLMKLGAKEGLLLSQRRERGAAPDVPSGVFFTPGGDAGRMEIELETLSWRGSEP